MMSNIDGAIDKFYEKLDTLISTVLLPDKLILLSDFNARVDKNHQAWEDVLGHHGNLNCNSSNGLKLLKPAYLMDSLLLTLFRLPKRNKTSWMHPRTRH